MTTHLENHAFDSTRVPLEREVNVIVNASMGKVRNQFKEVALLQLQRQHPCEATTIN